MSIAKKLLLADHDDLLRDSLRDQLTADGEFTIEEARTGAAALAACSAGKHDLIVLAADLPDMDGSAVCRWMRLGGTRCPVIMLAGPDGSGMTAALEVGANDCISKPFHFGALLARIHVQLGEPERNEDRVLTVGPYSFRPTARTLVDLEGDGATIRLTEKEAAILEYLLRTEHRVVDRTELLREIWGYRSGVTTHTLETHIYLLRQKIEQDPSRAEILRTASGGYRLFP